MAELRWQIREATSADTEIILHHRRNMFAEMDSGDENSRELMVRAARGLVDAGLRDGSYRAWLVEVEGRVVAGGGVAIVPFQPIPADPAPRRVWVLNMYTEPEYRHRGFARDLMRTIIDWCRVRRIPRLSLHASEAGRSLYEALGFRGTNEMRLDLE